MAPWQSQPSPWLRRTRMLPGSSHASAGLTQPHSDPPTGGLPWHSEIGVWRAGREHARSGILGGLHDPFIFKG